MKERKLCSGRDLAHMPRPLCWKCKHFRWNVPTGHFQRGFPWTSLAAKLTIITPTPATVASALNLWKRVAPLKQNDQIG